MTEKALDNFEKILDLPVDPDPDGAHVLRAKTTAGTTVLNIQSKVDESRLRRAQFDRLPDLIRLVNETAARLPHPIIDVTPS